MDSLISKTVSSGRNRKSKKPTKCCDLIDFVVIKKKSKKTQKIVTKKISSKPVKRGKVKRKKPTVLKKKVLKERAAKKNNQKEVHEDEITILEQQTENLDLSEKSEHKSQESTYIQHSRNFRNYCDHFITQEIKHYSEVVLKDLFKYQENKFQQNPVKAKAKRRYVVGFKEVKKFLKVERLKLIFIAPDLEKNSEIDKLVDEIKQLADQHKIQYIFSIKRRKLGYLLLKKVPVSIVGIFDYQGTTENVNILLDHVKKEKNLYKMNKVPQNA